MRPAPGILNETDTLFHRSDDAVDEQRPYGEFSQYVSSRNVGFQTVI
jgi:hypothetical protein